MGERAPHPFTLQPSLLPLTHLRRLALPPACPPARPPAHPPARLPACLPACLPAFPHRRDGDSAANLVTQRGANDFVG